MKSLLLFALTLFIACTSTAQRPTQPTCYKSWDAKNEIKSGDDFKVYLVYLQHLWDENGSNTHMYYSQVFEVTGTLSTTSYVNGQSALKNNVFSVYGRSDFVAAISDQFSGNANAMRGREVIIHGDLSCLNDMLEYWKKRNKADYEENTNVPFDFNYSYELNRVEANFEALNIKEM